MRNKGIELPVMSFVILLCLFAIIAAMMIMIMGRWFDLTGTKYTLITQRNAMDLIQLIVTNSPLVERDPSGEPMKLVLNATQLDVYESKAGIGIRDISSSSEREIWEKCCDFLDFDYNFTVHDLVTSKNRTIANLIFERGSTCYPSRILGVGDVPVVIDEDGKRNAGVAVVTMMRTPLSDLSFWLSQAFLRASWGDYWTVFSSEESYTVTVPLDPEVKCVNISDYNDNYKRICVKLIDDREACKSFYYDKNIEETGNFFLYGDNKMTSGQCFNVVILTKRNYVSIFYPGLYGDENKEC